MSTFATCWRYKDKQENYASSQGFHLEFIKLNVILKLELLNNQLYIYLYKLIELNT